MSTLENGKTIRLTVTGHITQPTEESIKVNGDLICGKAKGGKSSQMEQNSMEITGKTKRMEKGSFTGPTGTATLESSGTTSGKEKVLWNFMTEDSIRVNGSTTKCMDTENSPGRMEKVTKASTSMTRNKEKEGLIMETVRIMKANGSREDSTEEESSRTTPVRFIKADMSTVN